MKSINETLASLFCDYKQKMYLMSCLLFVLNQFDAFNWSFDCLFNKQYNVNLHFGDNSLFKKSKHGNQNKKYN